MYRSICIYICVHIYLYAYIYTQNLRSSSRAVSGRRSSASSLTDLDNLPVRSGLYIYVYIYI